MSILHAIALLIRVGWVDLIVNVCYNMVHHMWMCIKKPVSNF